MAKTTTVIEILCTARVIFIGLVTFRHKILQCVFCEITANFLLVTENDNVGNNVRIINGCCGVRQTICYIVRCCIFRIRFNLSAQLVSRSCHHGNEHCIRKGFCSILCSIVSYIISCRKSLLAEYEGMISYVLRTLRSIIYTNCTRIGILISKNTISSRNTLDHNILIAGDNRAVAIEVYQISLGILCTKLIGINTNVEILLNVRHI